MYRYMNVLCMCYRYIFVCMCNWMCVYMCLGISHSMSCMKVCRRFVDVSVLNAIFSKQSTKESLSTRWSRFRVGNVHLLGMSTCAQASGSEMWKLLANCLEEKEGEEPYNDKFLGRHCFVQKSLVTKQRKGAENERSLLGMQFLGECSLWEHLCIQTCFYHSIRTI